jgi:hypothetical protein
MEPLLSIGRQLPVRGSRSHPSRICGGPRARESAPRHRTSAACDSGGAGRPGRSDPGDPLCICAQGYYPHCAFKNASTPRSRPRGARTGHGPPSLHLHGHARRPRDGPAAARWPARRPRLPGAPVRPHSVAHIHTLRGRPARRSRDLCVRPDTTDLPSRLGRASTTANSTWTSPRSHVLARARGKGSILVILKDQFNEIP